MEESTYEDNYVYFEVNRGNLLVVEDLAERSYAYAEDIGYGSEERFEVREEGSFLGRFNSLNDAKEFLNG